MIMCPGCAGRNAPDSRTCQWCGRPFVDEHHPLAIPWLIPATIGAVLVLALGTVAVALLGARPAAPGSSEVAPIAVGASAGATQVVAGADSEPLPFDDEPALAPQSDRVRIANTGSTGAFIRREPRANAPGVVAHRDGTVLRIVGTDTLVAGRLWRNVEDQAGNRGWTPAEYLVSVDADS